LIAEWPNAVSAILQFDVVVALAIGTFVGIVVGALPGLGTVLGLVIALPFTYAMDVAPAMALLVTIYISSIYGGSISAILLNVPGTPQSAATCYDGYPMARSGNANLAIGFATAASFMGGLFSCAVLVFLAPPLADLALNFGPSEMFALLLFSLTTVAGVSSGEMLKGLLAAGIGIFLSLVGLDMMTGFERFAFGNLALSGGFAVIPLLIGLFAISEILVQATQRPSDSVPPHSASRARLPTLKDWKGRWGTLLRSSAIGGGIGVLPGTGAVAAVFVSYADAKRRSAHPERFGSGEPDGLIASEASNNAVSGGALVPTMALGIPGDGGTVVLLGALTIHGVVPGVRLFEQQPELVATIFALVLVANVFMFLFGMLGAPVFSSVLRAPAALLMPVVFMLSMVGAYAVRSSAFDVLTALVAGVIGFILRRNGFPLAPIIIGYVLGRPLESYLRQALVISDRDPLFFLQSPISSALVLLTALTLLGFTGIGKRLRSRFVRRN